MKKFLSVLAVVAFTTTLAVSAAEANSVSSFFDKLNQKEQEINQKIDAHQKARAEQRAAIEKKQRTPVP